MEKVAYLRLFGIPEIDNVNKKYYSKLGVRVIEDTDGSKFNEVFNNTNYDIVIDPRTLAIMLLHTVDVSKIDGSYENSPYRYAISKRDEFARRLCSRAGISHYNEAFDKSSAVSSDMTCALLKVVHLADEIELMTCD